ncbi:MAG: rRNA maturation RNase YbeY [Pseudomonadota bacterium]
MIEDAAWHAALPDITTVAGVAVRAALAGADVSTAGREITVLACDDTRIAELNATFRGKTAPTNVLSWPTFDLAPGAPGGRPPQPPVAEGPLGDIAIALGTTAREAENAGIALKDHCLHLILHATLHLLGYDHQTDTDAALMERIETDALASLGLPDPYDRGEAGTARRD